MKAEQFVAAAPKTDLGNLEFLGEELAKALELVRRRRFFERFLPQALEFRHFQGLSHYLFLRVPCVQEHLGSLVNGEFAVAAASAAIVRRIAVSQRLGVFVYL